MRHALSLLTLAALLWATVSLTPAPAHASIVQISGDPAPAGALTFSSNGNLAGQVPISIVTQYGNNGVNVGPTYPIFNGYLYFNLGFR